MEPVSNINTIHQIYGASEEYFTNLAPAPTAGWATPSWDLFVFVFFFAAVLIFVLSLNRERLFLALISTYITAAVIYLVPFLQGFFLKSSISSFWKVLSLLFILFLVIGLTSRIYTPRGAKFFEEIWQIVWFSVLATGLLFTLFFLIIPGQILARLSSLTIAIFDGAVARATWTILPILSLIFVKKR